VTRFFVATALALLLAPTVTAAPQPAVMQEAKRRFQRANQLYQDGRYTDALHLYQAAYDLVPSPDILFNLALTKEKVFDYEGCSIGMKQYLKQAQDQARRQQAEERLSHCRTQTTIPVKVSSLPPSAAITLGEGAEKSSRGRTPALLNLPPGSYAITVEAPGYLQQTQKITVEEGVHPDIDFTLEKLSSLHIEADVSGADVRIDGKAEGVTPLKRELPAGLYKVEIAHAGYRPVERQVRVNAGDQISLMLSMPSLPRERRVELDPVRGGPASAVIDGSAAGTLPIERQLTAGVHRLELSAPGRQPWSGDISVPDDRDLKLRVKLEPVRTRRQRIVFWTLQSVASALAVGGVVFGALALSDQATYDAHPSTAVAATGSDHAHWCDGLFAASAAVGIAGAIYYLATWPRHSSIE
jgi:hypothetical protein